MAGPLLQADQLLQVASAPTVSVDQLPVKKQAISAAVPVLV